MSADNKTHTHAYIQGTELQCTSMYSKVTILYKNPKHIIIAVNVQNTQVYINVFPVTVIVYMLSIE